MYPHKIELAWTPAGRKLLSLLLGWIAFAAIPLSIRHRYSPEILIAKPGEIAARSRASAAATEFAMTFE
jgi:hypothetical protein